MGSTYQSSRPWSALMTESSVQASTTAAQPAPRQASSMRAQLSRSQGRPFFTRS